MLYPKVLLLALVARQSIIFDVSTITPLLLSFTLPPLPCSPPSHSSNSSCPLLPSSPPFVFPSCFFLSPSISSPFFSFLHFLSLFSVQQTEQTKCPRAPMFFGLSLLMTLALHLFASTTNEQASEVSNSTEEAMTVC